MHSPEFTLVYNLLQVPEVVAFLQQTPTGERKVFNPQLVLEAWLALTVEQQLVLIRVYGLDGHPPASLKSLGDALGRTPSYAIELRQAILVQIRTYVWQPHQFHGLSHITVRLLLGAGLNHPDQLHGAIELIIDQDGFGKKMLAEIDTWLVSLRRPPLSPYVPPKHRARLGVKP